MSSQRRRMQKQRQVQYYHARRRVQFRNDSRGVIETEGDTIPSEGEGLCSQVSKSRSRGQPPQYENRPN